MSSISDTTPVSKWHASWRLMRFDRPIGALLLLWPTLWALWLAGQGQPSLKNLLVFVAGVFVMRAAGCVMNDIADRNFDPHVERTRDRPLARGDLAVPQAVALLLGLLLLALLLVLMTNLLTILLALPGLLLAMSYPFFKRITHLPQFVLGVAFGWGIPMAFAAQTGQVAPAAWWLLGINVVWAVIYDTLYAMVDREQDVVIGVKSTAILFGRYDLLILRLLKLLMLGLLLWLGLRLGLHWPWFAGVGVVAGLFGLQQWWVRGRSRQACFAAFKNHNWVGLAIFAGLAGHFLVS